MSNSKLVKLANEKNKNDTSCYKKEHTDINLDEKVKVANTSKKVANIYVCEKCHYQTSRKYNYDLHLSSDKHIKKLVKKYVCKKCNFSTNKKYNYHLHLSTDNHDTDLVNTYICDMCNYCTSNKYNYNKHINSNKHSSNNKYILDISNNGIYDSEKLKNNDLFMCIMNEMKNIMKEQNQTIMDTVLNNQMFNTLKCSTNTITNNIHNNKTNNQHFNLNLFLNETCKDAMNLSEFLENLNVSMEDMEKTGELGFAKGMSRIIMNNLNAIDVCKRPIHCSDAKRETLYIKNNGVWEKETEERKRTKEIIYKVSCLNSKQLLKWRDLARNKGYDNSEHAKNDEFMKLVMEVNKLRDEEIDKVITSISKHVAIDKDRVKMSGYLN